MPQSKVDITFPKMGKTLLNNLTVSKCSDLNCQTRDACEFATKEGPCRHERELLTTLMSQWVDPKDGIGDMLNQMEMNRICLMLLPFYQQQAKLSRELSGITRMTYADNKGMWHAYPQGEEFRRVSVMIMNIEKELGLVKLWEKKFGDDKTRPSEQAPEDILMHGISGAYEQMAAMEEDDEEDETNDA
jgi:hypothetical protein